MDLISYLYIHTHSVGRVHSFEMLQQVVHVITIEHEMINVDF